MTLAIVLGSVATVAGIFAALRVRRNETPRSAPIRLRFR